MKWLQTLFTQGQVNMRGSCNVETNNKWKLKVHYRVGSDPSGSFSSTNWQLKQTAVMWTKVKQLLRVYKAEFSKGLWSSLQPYVKPGWTTKHAGGRSALRDVVWWDRALGCVSGEGRGRHWQKGEAVEREVSLVMPILAYKTRPGFSIKPWSASFNHCGFGLYQLAHSWGNVWAWFGPHHVPGLFSVSTLDAVTLFWADKKT